MGLNPSGKISPYYPIAAAVAIALAFILCAAIGMALNPLSFDKFWATPQALPKLTGRSLSYYWDIASWRVGAEANLFGFLSIVALADSLALAAADHD